MLQIDAFSLGIVLFVIGLLFFGAVILLLRMSSRAHPDVQASFPLPENLLPEPVDSVMVVEQGGRVLWVNEHARQLFKLLENETPNLDRLARRIRPGEAFLKLCAAEGQARFVLDGRMVDGTSYHTGPSSDAPVLVTMRYPEMTVGSGDIAGSLSASTLQTFTRLTQEIAASLDLEKTLAAVMNNTEKLVAVDFIEITIWDSESQHFIPYRFTGQAGVERKLEAINLRYHLEDSLSGLLYRDQKPMMAADLEARADLWPIVERLSVPIRSYLGCPLMVGNEFIGTLEIGSPVPDVYHEPDLDMLRLLSGQAAIAIHNALLYDQEQQRIDEMNSLSKLAQALSSVRDPATFYARLVESIAPLVKVDILGFLIYNESTRVLEGKIPFKGIPEPVMELYRVPIAAGSAAEQALIHQDMVVSENAGEDPAWEKLGIARLAAGASLRETELIPLASAGHMLGYLQASNHTGGSLPFTRAETHLLTIIANQAASIIENASLVQQSRQRALRAEALRRIASLAGSAATLDEILRYSLQELDRLLRSDVAVIFLINSDHSRMELHPASIYEKKEPLSDRMTHILLDDPQFPFTVSGGERAFTSNNLSIETQPIIPFYQTFLSYWSIESVVAVPMIVRNEGIGELWFGSKSPDFFDQVDIQAVSTAAGQLASVVEQSFLRSQTDETLRWRVEQMTSITRISRELSTTLDLNYLLQLVYDEALRTTKADCGTILLFQLDKDRESGKDPALRFFVGDEPGESLSRLERQVLESDTPRLVADLNRSEHRVPHEGIQSMLVVPISHQQYHAGLIVLHGKALNQFDATSIEITQSLAVQAAVAINNAITFEEQTRRGTHLMRELETLTHLIEVTRTLRPNLNLHQSLASIAEGIRSATPFSVVLISIISPTTQLLHREVGMGMPEETWQELSAREQPWRGIQQLLQPDFKIGEAYFIPADKSPVIPEDVHIVSILPIIEARANGNSWQPDDMLLLPLYDGSKQPLGLISVDAPRDGRRPDRPAYEALELFAAQAGLVMENYQHNHFLATRVTELEADAGRMNQSVRQAQANLPVLLHKELEQSIMLRGLNQRTERIRATLDIAAEANRQATREDVLHTLASELVTRFAMQVALVAVRSAGDIHLVEVVGSFPAGANPEALFGQRNPLRQILSIKDLPLKDASAKDAQARPEVNENLLLVASLEDAPEWQNVTMLSVLEARSMIGLQVNMGNDQTAGVLAIGQRTLPAFLEEDRRVFSQLAYQVSVGLQNLLLLTETRQRLKEVNLLLDFSRKLGSLQPADILTTLIESITQALPDANTGWVGMWDDKQMALIPQAAVGYASRDDLLGIRYALQAEGGEVADTRVVLPLRVFRTGQTERVAEIQFSVQYHLSPDDLLRYKRSTGGRLPISALLIPVRVGDNVLGVVCLENFESQAAFSDEDENLAYSFTRQAAMALENARLFQASEQRATQLQTLTMVAGTITSSLQRDQLIALLLDQLKVVVPYNTATLWLRQGGVLTVAAATGFADNDSRLNLSVAVEDSLLFKTMIQTMEPISVGDVRNDPRFPSLIEPENLSWLAIPLIYQSEVIGAVALEKQEADFYAHETIQAAKTIAGQAAVALENARLFEDSIRRAAELDERSQRLALLNQLSGELTSSLDVDYILRVTAQQLSEALSASGVLALMIGAGGHYILQIEAPAPDELLPLTLPAVPLLDRLRESHGVFISDDAYHERELAPLAEGFLQKREARSLLVVPLISGSALLGWFMVTSREAYRYSSSEVELAHTICNQAAVAAQNARLFAETRSLTEDLERRVEERTHEVFREHQNSQTLLKIITELSTSLDMGLVLNRTLSVLNESVGAEESGIILSQGQGVQYRAGVQLTSAADAESKKPGVEQQIARWVIRSRQPAMIAQVQEDGRWEFQEGQKTRYQSVLAVPLVMGEEILGALLLFHSQAGFFTQNQIDLIEATARQIGISLNNAELFNLIRDQSEHLGAMLREQQIEASRSRAILEAVADGVLVTEARGRINLFNASAERILSLSNNEVMGKSLDQFVGLFGRTAKDWVQTINSWSQDPQAHSQAETYAERIDLDNGRIVAVHLAPVFWRNEFLGTVSIFRDITHEVQVERMKSEFVANVSHELRTPMTSIKGYVEIMLMGATGQLSPQQVHFLGIVKSNTERLSVLVNDLLDVSRIEAGRLTLNTQALDLREIAEDVIADIQRRSKEENRPMQFLIDVPKGLPFAAGDRERVRQVLSNLVSNGYNYTPDNGCVTVHINETGKALQVDVEDTGIGIAPAEQRRIFERFYRGEDPLVLATAGFGLGLAIAKTLVEMHHGRIWFTSSGSRGEGSVFSFTLPEFEDH